MLLHQVTLHSGPLLMEEIFTESLPQVSTGRLSYHPVSMSL